MGMHYRNLDERIRTLMNAEIEQDIENDRLYISDNLNAQGKHDYPGLLMDAALNGNDDSFAEKIRIRLNTHEKPRRLKSGGFSKPPKMRSNAHEMLAEGEFNRYYIRAVCLLAIKDHNNQVRVYSVKG